jgi:hypothetical protein
MNLRALVLRPGVRAAVLKLLPELEEEAAHVVNMAGQPAKGFVLGLETASAFHADTI